MKSDICRDYPCGDAAAVLYERPVQLLLIGKADSSVDAASGATTRETLETKTNIIE